MATLEIMGKSRSTTISAQWVFPVEGPPIANGFISVVDGRIHEISERRGRATDWDFSDSAVVPGFVNAHTHLELPSIDQEPREGPEDQIEWLKRVIGLRREVSWEDLRTQSQAGLRASVAAGTTSLADITTAGASWSAVSEGPVRGVVFAEILGIRRSRGLETARKAWDWIGSVDASSLVKANCRIGLSPHAPYSTAGWLYCQSAEAGLPLATHLAELPEERELLETGQGRLRTFLEELGAWDPDFEPIGPSPADYIRKGELRNADWLCAHGNLLNPSEFWQFLHRSAPSGQRVALAYCPRTHTRFGNPPHPFPELLARGAIVCIGTDSLASSPSLSVLDEIRHLRRTDSRVDPGTLLAMATIYGAWAIRAETVTGSLKPGKSADLAVIALESRDTTRNPDEGYDALMCGNGAVIGVMYEGNWSVPPDPSRLRSRSAST